MQFMDMNPELVLMVTDYLPDYQKINLVDIIPAVKSQVTIFDIDRILEHRRLTKQEGDAAKVLEQFKKLTSIKKIVSSRYYYEEFENAICSGRMKTIETFEGFYDLQIIKFIKNIMKIDPSYNGSCIKNKLSLMSYSVQKFLQECQNLKLKLQLYLGKEDNYTKVNSYRQLIEGNETIRDMIVKLMPNRTFIESLSNSIVLLSVTNINLHQIQIRSITSDLKPVIRLAPNLNKLTIELNLNIVEDIHRLSVCLFSIIKLESLNIEMIASSLCSNNIMSQLTSIVNHNSLKNLSIVLSGISISDWFSHSLQIRKGMKYFRFKNYEENCEIIVKGCTMLIRNMTLSLRRIMNKFPRVNMIKLITNDRQYISKATREFQSMNRSFSRNKCIHFSHK